MLLQMRKRIYFKFLQWPVNTIHAPGYSFATFTVYYFSVNCTYMETKPLIYSCSGCSSAAQMANYIAVAIDRSGDAEMSCIAGVGGNVKKLLKTALSGRKIIVLDGCPLSCARACLRNHGVEPAVHVELSRLGVKKRQHEDFDAEQAREILASVRDMLPA